MSDNIDRRILAAIDFGTTFSAIVWCQAARYDLDYCVLQQWPGKDGRPHPRTENDVPTLLRYDGSGKHPRWGFQIDSDEARIERFKLGLHPASAQQQSYVNLRYSDPRAQTPDSTQKPTVLVRHYLQALHNHFLADLTRQLGETIVSTTKIEYILTVPAIWGDKAKDDTRACARAAGFGDDIHMISEPEAAVTHALKVLPPAALKAGDTFVLVDAGGGTVDLISYCVEKVGDTFEVSEVAPGSGGLCGGSYLNQIVRDFVIGRLGNHPRWEEYILDAAMDGFESLLKRDFDGSDANYSLPVPGIPANPALGVHRGRLRLTLDELKKIFEPVVNAIAILVQNQIHATKRKVRAILMVGGFGQSPYLKRVIEAVVGHRIEVLQPHDGALAVAKGALQRMQALNAPGMSRVRVRSRVARKAFGVIRNVPFQDNKHNIKDRAWSEYHGSWVAPEMHWLIKKGDILREDKATIKDLYTSQPRSEKRFGKHDVHIFMYEGPDSDTPPTDPSHDGILPCVVLTADLSKIPMTRLGKTIGDDREKRFELHFQIRVNSFSAHDEFSLWFQDPYDGKDKCYGKVKAQYV